MSEKPVKRYHMTHDRDFQRILAEVSGQEFLKFAQYVRSEDYDALKAENERLREALRDTTVNLLAAVSLLKSGGKKAAASDKMFAQMLVDYANSVERGRAAIDAAMEPATEPAIRARGQEDKT